MHRGTQLLDYWATGRSRHDIKASCPATCVFLLCRKVRERGFHGNHDVRPDGEGRRTQQNGARSPPQAATGGGRDDRSVI